ncbi:MAG: hypothetical protein U5L45_23105 [Saprospiraceae bacterium]|nr:hypothetical protein [Saprospiraceae bacterium]
MWFVFRRSRKTNHVSSLLRERSARKTFVFNHKTMFLGYAHSSFNLSFVVVAQNAPPLAAQGIFSERAILLVFNNFQRYFTPLSIFYLSDIQTIW